MIRSQFHYSVETMNPRVIGNIGLVRPFGRRNAGRGPAACAAAACAILLALVAARPAQAEDPSPPPGMVPYDHPVFHNGKRVLWHGAFRGKDDKSEDDKAADDAPDDKPKPKAHVQAKAEPKAAVDAKPETDAHEITVLADGDDVCATRMAGELATFLAGAGFKAKAVSGHVSASAVGKAVAADSADFAIVPLDSLVGAGKTAAAWRDKAPYVARLGDERVEVFAPKPFHDLDQLTGKRVAVGPVDSAGVPIAAALFQRLNVHPVFIGEAMPIAMADVVSGKVDAVMLVGGGEPKGLADAAKDGKLHVMAIRWAPALRGGYAPTTVTAKDRPGLVDGDEKIDTVAAPLALIALDAAPDSPRARRDADVVAAVFTKFAALQSIAPDTSWRDVNLAASVDWPRLASAQSWVAAHAKTADPSLDAFRTSARAVAAASGGLAPSDADKLYRSLIEWRASTP